MRILQISDYYHIGSGHPLNNFCEELTKRGHEVKVFTSTISLFPIYKDTKLVNIRKFKGLKLLGKAFYPGVILKLLTQKNPDVVHSHVVGFFSTFISGYLKLIKKYPLIVTADFDVAEPEPSLLKSIYIFFYRKIPAQMADKITTFTEKEKEEFSKRFGIDKRKIVVLPIGIHFEKFSPPSKKDLREELSLEGKFIVLNVSYGLPKKNLETIIRAIREIKDENVIFMHIGNFLDNAYSEYLNELVNNLGLENRVIFLENISYDDLPDYYKISDVFVQAGHRESYAIPVLEAMASGVPVISTKSGIASEVIKDWETGFIANTEEDISEKIELLRSDSELRKKNGKNCKEVAKEYNWESIIGRLEGIYKNLV